MKYIQHPLIKPGKLEERTYQLSIALSALDGNTMVVLPTGLGKTAVALLTAASRLHNSGGKILMLAPTKPLVEQHYRFFQHFLHIPEDEHAGNPGFAMFTGETKIPVREESWKTSKLIFATPQVVKNDCLAGRYGFEDVSLLIVDECHRAVGNYAYVFITQHYQNTANKPLVLAMTASPGSDPNKVQDVCQNLGIEIVETRSDDDDDVRPYVYEKEVQYISIDLPESLSHALEFLNKLMDSRLAQLGKMGYHVPKREHLSMKQLNALNASIQQRIRNRDASAFNAASIYAECMKLRHAISLAESQGSESLKNYLNKLSSEALTEKASRASKRLAHDPNFLKLLDDTKKWEGELHPKPDFVLNLVRIQLSAFPESRIIVFATYRDTVHLLVNHLKNEGIACERFVGQATKDTERGLSQKKQLEALGRFREGDFKVLVATSVGEEGLDVPSTDMVIFYEAVPSEIRSIQRKGRTGRHGTGRIIVLVTKGTSDEAFRYVSQSREKAMHSGMKNMSSRTIPKKKLQDMQTSIETFIPEGPAVTVDDRETSSKVIEHLHLLGADITVQRLEHGDYAVGNRILVERKTTRDFVATLVDRDLLGQVRNMAASVPRPVLIIEGDDLFSVRNIHPNAIRGALAAIAIDMGVSIFFTTSAQETADLLFILGKREESDRSSTRAVHPHKTYRSNREHQEHILSAFPGIGLRHARLLLDHFGSLQAVINADQEELQQVLGIGEKIAKTLWELSRRKYVTTDLK
jgi:ERCC4-related helicase